jgi:hypothetical protein
MTMSELRFGHVPGRTVRDWLESHVPRLTGLPYVLIASVDSDQRTGTMPWVLDRVKADPNWAFSLSPLVISGASLVGLLGDRNLFTGFDELWIPREVPAIAPPDDAYLVAPRDLAEEMPDSILRWVEDSQCRLGVGDGDGLNFVALDLPLARSLDLF